MCGTSYSLIGNCSQGSFVKKTLREELKLEGKSTTVTVKTLNGDCKYSSLAVHDLEAANIQGKQVDWINLPVSSDEIATPENI